MSGKITTAGVIEEAGNARKNKTGSWRTSKPKITEQCIGCGMCVPYCPEKAITIEERNGKKIAVIDFDYCKGCMLCASVCPSKSIEKEKKE